MRSSDWSSDVCSSDLLLLITAKVVLAGRLVTSSIGTALCLIAAISANVSRKRRRASAQRENPVSGLPNFEALRSQPPFGSATVIAARIVNFEDLAAFLPGEGSQQLVDQVARSEEHTSELQSLMRISYAVFCLKKKKQT